jgi:hypothetical protein
MPDKRRFIEWMVIVVAVTHFLVSDCLDVVWFATVLLVGLHMFPASGTSCLSLRVSSSKPRDGFWQNLLSKVCYSDFDLLSCCYLISCRCVQRFRRNLSSLSSTLKTEAICSSEIWYKTNLQGATTQKITIWTGTAVKTLNLMKSWRANLILRRFYVL